MCQDLDLGLDLETRMPGFELARVLASLTGDVHLDALAVLVVGQQRLQVLPAVEAADAGPGRARRASA